MKVRITGPASRDLRAAFDFLFEDNPRAARAALDALFDAIRGLADMPSRGRPGRVAGTREFVVSATGHIVIYVMRSDEVAVLRVRHGHQLWPDQP